MENAKKHIIFTQPRYHSSAKLLQQFDSNVIAERYDTTYNLMHAFIDECGLNGRVVVNTTILGAAILDYYENISRLKLINDLPKANSIKCFAYLSYWLLRRKALQIIDTSIEEDNNALQAYVRVLGNLNERFVLKYICTYFSSRDKSKGNIIGSEKIGLNRFVEALLYHLTYENFDPRNLEMIIFAFCAGQIYENTERDISEDFHPYDESLRK
ncbi:MAG: hypothetical protein FWD82_11140 [Defluviitaleaceae bacterium]|nr:hypothetical protein [Defluviitaleaceae bacterium]